jgi:hypothetical protein
MMAASSKTLSPKGGPTRVLDQIELYAPDCEG